MSSATNHPLVSIIVPTYNEERDIARTLEALAAQAYRSLEVIIVDASQDRTPEIVCSYADRIPNLRLVKQGNKPGVSAARNIGLREAQGEIVVILNADVFPGPDFVERVISHYENGADYLVIYSQVVNVEHLYPRYIQAQHVYNHHLTSETANWTEGFSCRREAALAVGGFREDFAHNTAGEDAIFGNLLAQNYRRAADFSIVVPHTMPTELSVYWRQRLGRGRGGAYVLYVHERRPMRWPGIVRSVLGTLFLAGLAAPAIVYVSRLLPIPTAGCGSHPFTWARLVEMAATAIGYWDGCREIARSRYAGSP
jgi:glycosyltransferase involved in cell wall biosynthesis